MIPFDKLDDDQRRFIDVNLRTKQENQWLQGHAGSGKTVLLVHGLRDALVQAKQKGQRLTVGVAVFTHALADLVRTGLRELRVEQEFQAHIKVDTYYQFSGSAKSYDIIFCDEVQDLPEDRIQALLNLTKRLVVAGDIQQSIYKEEPQTNKPVILPERIGPLVTGDTVALTKIYRLSRRLIKIASIFGLTELNAKSDATKKDTEIKLVEAPDPRSEVAWVWREAQDYANSGTTGSTPAILLSTNKGIAQFCMAVLSIENKKPWPEYSEEEKSPNFNSLNDHLAKQQIPLMQVGGSKDRSLAQAEGKVIVMTYHSSKGLDFTTVFLPWLKSGQFIAYYRPERVLGVALTRSRENLAVSYSGVRHRLITDAFAAECAKKTVGPGGSSTSASATPSPQRRPAAPLSSDADNDLPF